MTAHQQPALEGGVELRDPVCYPVRLFEIASSFLLTHIHRQAYCVLMQLPRLRSLSSPFTISSSRPRHRLFKFPRSMPTRQSYVVPLTSGYHPSNTCKKRIGVAPSRVTEVKTISRRLWCQLNTCHSNSRRGRNSVSPFVLSSWL
jgi:hypothetical protein